MKTSGTGADSSISETGDDVDALADSLETPMDGNDAGDLNDDESHVDGVEGDATVDETLQDDEPAPEIGVPLETDVFSEPDIVQDMADAPDGHDATDTSEHDGELCVPPDPPWWVDEWPGRRRLQAETAPAGFSYRIMLSSGTTPPSGELYDACLSTAGDLRVLAWNGSAWTEVDRVVEAFERDTIVVWFQHISSAHAYYFYYGNAGAGDPPDDPGNVFLWFDDFNRADGDPGVGALYGVERGGTWRIVSNELQQTTATAFNSFHPLVGASWQDIEIRYRWRPGDTGCVDSGPIVQWIAAEERGYYIERQGGQVYIFEYPAHTALYNVAQPAPSRDWHVHVLMKISDRLTLIEDGATLLDTTGIITAGPGTAGIATYCTGLPFLYDDLRIRMAADPEPAVVVGAEETDCP
ncbi:MAG: hypothetical protein ABIJ56_19655 [Pseudomonadota bacterium]